MGAVEQTRRVVQDFPAPEMRELKARVEALEATTKVRFDSLEASTGARFEELKARVEALETKMGARIDAQGIQLQAIFGAVQDLKNYYAPSERVSQLEQKRKPEAEAQH